MRTARVHHAARRRGGSVAARGACAAGRASAAHRRADVHHAGRAGIAGPHRGVRSKDCRGGLGRRPQRADRHPLGGGDAARFARTRRNWSRSAGRLWWPASARPRATLLQATRTVPIVFARSRSGRRRLHREPGAAGRQHDRVSTVRIRHEREMAGIAQGDRAASHARGESFGISRASRWGRAMGRDPGLCAVDGGGAEPGRCAPCAAKSSARSPLSRVVRTAV